MNSTNRKRSHDSIESRDVQMENHIHIVQEVNGDTFSTDLQERYGAEGVEDISDIQKALAHLISINEGFARTNPTQNQDTTFAIPNLINNILKKYYPTDKEKKLSKDKQKAVQSMDEKLFLTQLLVAAIVEFAEPHFVRTSKSQSKKSKMESKSKMKSKTEGSNSNSSFHSIEFSMRATTWATTCLSRLLKTTISTDESIHIPELDALLGATGEVDAVQLEEMMQQSLLCGMMGARSDKGDIFDFRMKSNGK